MLTTSAIAYIDRVGAFLPISWCFNLSPRKTICLHTGTSTRSLNQQRRLTGALHAEAQVIKVLAQVNYMIRCRPHHAAAFACLGASRGACDDQRLGLKSRLNLYRLSASHTSTGQEHRQSGGNKYPVFKYFHEIVTAGNPVPRVDREEAGRDMPLPSKLLTV